MTNDDGRKPEGAPERPPKAGAGAPSDVEGSGPKRFSVRRKLAVVARLLRGEPGTGGPRDECLRRQADRKARPRAFWSSNSSERARTWAAQGYLETVAGAAIAY